MNKSHLMQHLEWIIARVKENTLSEDTDYILYFPGMLIHSTLQVLVREALHNTWEHVHFGQEEVELEDGAREAVWFIHLSGRKSSSVQEYNTSSYAWGAQ